MYACCNLSLQLCLMYTSEDKDHLKLIVDKPGSSEGVSRESTQSLASNAQQLESVLNLSRRVRTSHEPVNEGQSSVQPKRRGQTTHKSRGETDGNKTRLVAW